jgi:hypothetical protein
MTQESESQRQLRGYSESAWEARRFDLIAHDEAYALGIKVASKRRKVDDIRILSDRRHEIIEEIDRSYPLECSDSIESND